MNKFLFGVLPYVVLTLFIVVPIIRRRQSGFTFTTRASGFIERRSMGIAALTLHWGIITIFIGHMLGLIGGLTTNISLINVFHWLGMGAGVAIFYGTLLALLRRIAIPEMRAISQSDDYLVLILLLAIVATGIYPVLADKSFGLSILVAPWVKSIAIFQPDVAGMAGLSLLAKTHITLGLVLCGYFPFTKLVHMWTIPFSYFVRPYQSVRTYRKVAS